MPFEFIDQSAIDTATRRRIRSHVAMGKNAGRTLSRPSKKAQALRTTTASALVRVPKTIQNAYWGERNQNRAPEIERQVDDGMCFPVRLDAVSRRLAQRVFYFLSGPRFAAELYDVLDCTSTSVSIWVQYMLVDEAYFHSTVALAINSMNKLLCEKEDTTDAIRHLSRTMQLVNERLAGNRAVSDETLAVVVSLAQYERHQNQYVRGFIHMQGLRRMIEVRGGISKLARDKPSLSHKIFRVDLEYALQLGSTPFFTLQDVELSAASLFGQADTFKRPANHTFVNEVDSKLFKNLKLPLWGLFLDLRYAASQLNASAAHDLPKLSSFEFHGTVITFGYRLVSINPLGGPYLISSLENVIHLGLAAFLMTFLRGLDRLIAENPLLTDLARTAARVHSDPRVESQTALLWLLYLGRGTIFKEQDDKWLLPKLKQTMHRLDFQGWEDVRQAFCAFPWVDRLHTTQGRELFHRSLWVNEDIITKF